MVELKDKVVFHSKVLVQLFNPDGSIKDESLVTNTVTNVGDAWVADQLSDRTGGLMSHMAVGDDDAPAPAVTDTTLNNELHREALTSTTQGAAGDDNDVIYIADYAAGHGTGALVEAGIFDAAVAGNMLCRAIYDVKNKGALDTLKITWTFTCGAS